jgi:hypothetical protein
MIAVVATINGLATLIDVDAARDVKRCVEDHPRRRLWSQRSGGGGIGYAACYMPLESKRRLQQLFQDIRSSLSVACGDGDEIACEN